MKNILNCCFVLLLGGLSCANASPVNTWTMSLNPGAVISGPAGSTIGWGYSITNDSTTQWLVLENLTETPLQHVSSLDAVFDYPILAPGATVTESYVPGTSGLLGLTWTAAAPLYFVNTGNFVVSADWYHGNPLSGGTDLGAAAQETLQYTAQVGLPSTSTNMPEPAALSLCCVSLAVFIFQRLCRRA